MLSTRKKATTIKKARKHNTDTGSAAVQIGILSEQINELVKHLKKHTKDIHSRRGLLQMVAKRRSHLKYLEEKDEKAYNAVVKKFSLKKRKVLKK